MLRPYNGSGCVDGNNKMDAVRSAADCSGYIGEILSESLQCGFSCCLPFNGMNWKIKALIQSALANFPSGLSYDIYYKVQRNWGGLKAPSLVGMAVAIDGWDQLVNQGCDPSDKVFFEVGTGRTPLIAISFWLMGARSTVTFDLNPYLKEELTQEVLQALLDNSAATQQQFGARLLPERYAQLAALVRSRPRLQDVLQLCQIRYLAPGDARQTDLASDSVDVHFSNNVMEHVPSNDLSKILQEARRILKPQGLALHHVDYVDHFSYSDPSISSVNFLRFSERQWKWWAGNRYMYMNRLRHDDYLGLFDKAGLKLRSDDFERDENACKQIERQEILLDAAFKNIAADRLAISRAWIVTAKN